jgi:hypothetical protein
MSIFGIFRRDPMRDWPECRPVPLVFDLSRGELNGIPFEAPTERLRGLGRPAAFRELSPHSRAACYPALGLEIELSTARSPEWVESFVCLFRPPGADPRAGKGAAPRSCEIVLQPEEGEGVRVTAGTTLQEAERHFGRGALHVDEDGSVLQATAGGVWLYFDFDSGGRLRILEIEHPDDPEEHMSRSRSDPY